jgi:hypothetical protein
LLDMQITTMQMMLLELALTLSLLPLASSTELEDSPAPQLAASESAAAAVYASLRFSVKQGNLSLPQWGVFATYSPTVSFQGQIMMVDGDFCRDSLPLVPSSNTVLFTVVTYHVSCTPLQHAHVAQAMGAMGLITAPDSSDAFINVLRLVNNEHGSSGVPHVAITGELGTQLRMALAQGAVFLDAGTVSSSPSRPLVSPLAYHITLILAGVVALAVLGAMLHTLRRKILQSRMYHLNDVAERNYNALIQSAMSINMESYSRLPTTTYKTVSVAVDDGCSSTSSATVCVVCLEPQEPSQQLLSLPCEHHFHLACVQTWLQSKYSCPICKFNCLLHQPAVDVEDDVEQQLIVMAAHQVVTSKRPSREQSFVLDFVQPRMLSSTVPEPSEPGPSGMVIASTHFPSQPLDVEELQWDDMSVQQRASSSLGDWHPPLRNQFRCIRTPSPSHASQAGPRPASDLIYDNVRVDSDRAASV